MKTLLAVSLVTLAYCFSISVVEGFAMNQNTQYRLNDSSKTRVVPVFTSILASNQNWTTKLLKLPKYGATEFKDGSIDLSVITSHFGNNEFALSPSKLLLEWLIHNPPIIFKDYKDKAIGTTEWKRYHLWKKDNKLVDEALNKLNTVESPSGWYVLEGKSYPDVTIFTQDAIIVIEGKRTEPTATKSTKWMKTRHQIWRHIDNAWEIRNKRKVFGFFIVESKTADVPEKWVKEMNETISENAIANSLPHRNAEERLMIKDCFIGATTWKAVCEEFKINCENLFNKK